MISLIPNVRRSILVLKGVKITDIISEVKIKVEKQIEPVDAGYTPLVSRFTGVDSIKWTNLKCWYCDLIPKGMPKFVPKNIEVKNDGSIHCDMEGVFSHWVCAVEYCYKEKSGSTLGDALDSIKTLRSYITKQPPQITRRAIPRTRRQCYSGNSGLNDEEYTKMLDYLENLSPPTKLTSINYD